MTAAEIDNDFANTVSANTIWNIFYEAGYQKRIAHRKPCINKATLVSIIRTSSLHIFRNKFYSYSFY